MRLETTITDRPDIERIQYLQRLLDAPNASLLREALMVYGWAVREILTGRRIASVGPTGAVREFTSPLLERLNWMSRERVQFAGEGFARVAELVNEPPEPTPELRELIGEEAEEEALVG